MPGRDVPIIGRVVGTVVFSRFFSVSFINRVVATSVKHCNVAANVKTYKNLFLLNLLMFALAQNWGSEV